MPGEYGVTIVRTVFLIGKCSVFSAHHATEKEAWEAAFAIAIFHGWTPARWWQFWRRHDTRVPEGIDLAKLPAPKFYGRTHPSEHYGGTRS